MAVEFRAYLVFVGAIGAVTAGGESSGRISYAVFKLRKVRRYRETHIIFVLLMKHAFYFLAHMRRAHVVLKR